MPKTTKQKKILKTFFIKEVKANIVKQHTTYIFKYKHLENVLNILLQQQLQYNSSLFLTLQNNTASNSSTQQNLTIQKQLNEQLTQGKEIFNLLLNPIIMKAVLMGNSGGIKTQHTISKVNHYFNDINNSFNSLFIQVKNICKELNDKNVSMIIRRLRKDWSNYFEAVKQYHQNTGAFNGKPSYPKAKKLSKVFNYSVPLESDKFSIKKKGFLGITLGKKMQYVYIGQAAYFKDKKINNVTVSYSHGSIYYHFTYEYTNKEYINKQTKALANKNNILDNVKKKSGIDVGVENTLSLFIMDKDTKSLIFSGKELISYNCYFNKELAKINELISYEVKTYKSITDKNGKTIEVPEVYRNKGRSLINERSLLFERRKLYFDDYMQKLSKKIIEYLLSANVTDLALSKNLSFTKTTGEIKMKGKTKQKFYQIPFGRLLNLIESKAVESLINVTWINEAYTSKTSSISSEVVEVQNKAKVDKNLITPNDLNGNRGVKRKGNLKNKLGRGLFLDSIINKVLNADLNAACNHIKVAFTEIDKNVVSKLSLSKFCNPMKIKSNHEFDKILKNIKLKNNIDLSSCNYQIVDRKLGRKYYLSDVETQKQH